MGLEQIVVDNLGWLGAGGAVIGGIAYKMGLNMVKNTLTTIGTNYTNKKAEVLKEAEANKLSVIEQAESARTKAQILENINSWEYKKLNAPDETSIAFCESKIQEYKSQL
jgi:hypothetical protein